jgi:hypothetical protein
MSDEKVSPIPQATVSANEPPLFTPHDMPIESANNYVRTALLNDPDVVEHLCGLDNLRREWKLSPNQGKLREASLGGMPLQINAAFSEQRRYELQLEASPLVKRGVFSAAQLDRQVAIVRERVETGWWGKLIPVNDRGAGYGRQKARKADRRSVDALELAVAAVVREINPDREPRALAEAHPGTVRTNLHRLRKLALL